MARIKQAGMPYMGNKRKIAFQLITKMLKDNPNAKYFYDLFGGGGSMSFEAIQRPQIEKVFYNELNSGVVALLNDIIENGVTDKYFNWVDRETFEKHKKDEDWFGGLCKVVWSFGNNQKDYLFGKKVEPIKKLAHEYIVNRCEDSKKELENIFGVKIPSFNQSIFGYDIQATKRELSRYMKNNADRMQLQQIDNIGRIQQIERLQQIERTNLSYDQVEINTPIEETIIYLDPPYKSTKKYELNIDHDKLLGWIKESRYKIYVSSYEFEGLKEVMAINHRSILSATAINEVVEKLFTNK